MRKHGKIAIAWFLTLILLIGVVQVDAADVSEEQRDSSYTGTFQDSSVQAVTETDSLPLNAALDYVILDRNEEADAERVVSDLTVLSEKLGSDNQSITGDMVFSLGFTENGESVEPDGTVIFTLTMPESMLLEADAVTEDTTDLSKPVVTRNEDAEIDNLKLAHIKDDKTVEDLSVKVSENKETNTLLIEFSVDSCSDFILYTAEEQEEEVIEDITEEAAPVTYASDLSDSEEGNIPIIVTKQWKDSSNNTIDAPEGIDAVTVTLTAPEGTTEDVTLNAGSGWTETFETAATEDNTDDFSLTENTVVPGYTTSIVKKLGGNGWTIYDLNSLSESAPCILAVTGAGYAITSSGNKVFDPDAVPDETLCCTVTKNSDGMITIEYNGNYLYANGDNLSWVSAPSSATSFTITGDGYIQWMSRNKNRYLTITKDKIGSTDQTSKATAVTFYTVKPGSLNYVVTNKQNDVIPISVNKVWQDSKGKPIDAPEDTDVTVTLTAPDGTSEAVTLNEDSGWKHNFTATATEDNINEFTLTEDNVPGFTGTVSRSSKLIWNEAALPDAEGESVQYAVVGGGYVLTGSSGTSAVTAFSEDDTADRSLCCTITKTAAGYTIQSGDYYLIANGDNLSWNSDESAAASFTITDAGIISWPKDSNNTNYVQISKDGLKKADSKSATAFSFYNAKVNGLVYTVTNKQDAKTSFTVTKTWGDGTAKHSGDDVTVWLYANGVRTEQKVVLNAANNWTADFSELTYKTEDGSVISYSVQEEPVTGYTANYGSVSKDYESSGDVWVKVDQPTDGHTYLVVSDSYVLTDANKDNKLNKSLVTITDNTIPSYTDTLGEWLYTTSGTGFTLQNVSTGNNLTLYDGAFKAMSGAASTKNVTKLNLDASGHIYATKSDGKIKYLKVKTGITDSVEAKDNSDDASSLTFYERQADSTPFYSQNIKNVKNAGGSSSTGTETKLDHSKTIDYLGDNAYNPDTSAVGDDLYRLYLDVTGSTEPVDLLLVVDDTTSLYYAMDTDDTTGDSRVYIEDDILNGTKIDYTGARRGSDVSQMYDGDNYASGEVTRADDGLIQRFMSINPANMIAVTTFSGSRDYTNKSPLYNYSDVKSELTGTPLNWTSVSDLEDDYSVNLSTYTDMGTSYVDAYLRMGELLSEVENDGHQKIVIFITDGEPNDYPDSEGYLRNGVFSQTGYDDGAFEGIGNDIAYVAWDIFKNGAQPNEDGTYTSALGGLSGKIPSKYIYSSALEATGIIDNPNLFDDTTIYTVGISTDCAKDSNASKILSFMVDGDTSRTYPAVTIDDMDNALNGIVDSLKPSNITITDNLSQYVSWYSESPDLVVRLTDAEGNYAVIWQSEKGTAASSGTIGAAVNNAVVYDASGNDTGMTLNGADILDSVVYYPSSSDNSTGMVRAKLRSDYILGEDCKLEISFNVQTTQKALDDYVENGGYKTSPDAEVNLGDPDTDYTVTDNETSSEKPGWDSNDSADVTYELGNIAYDLPYDDPVVQINVAELMLSKTWSGIPKGDIPDSIDVNVYASYFDPYTGEYGEEQVLQKVTLSGDDWSATLNVKRYTSYTDAEGTVVRIPIKYRIQEIGETDGKITLNGNPYDVTYQNSGKAQFSTEDQTTPVETADLAINNGAQVTELKLLKENTEGSPLSDAEFRLLDQDGNLYTDSSNKICKNTSEADGRIVFKDLLIKGTDITLTLRETKAPDGYRTVSDYTVVIGADGTITVKDSSGNIVSPDESGYIHIVDRKVYDLPKAGGPGTYLFTIFGTMLITAALLLLCRRRRMMT